MEEVTQGREKVKRILFGERESRSVRIERSSREGRGVGGGRIVK